MTSYLRYIFGGASEKSATRKSHHRSRSTPTTPVEVNHPASSQVLSSSQAVPQNPPFPLQHPPKSASASRQRSESLSTATRVAAPSPLRYESTSQQPPECNQLYQIHPNYQQYGSQSSRRPAIYRASSHSVRERPPLYPLYVPTGSFSSTHSSNSSIHPGSSSRPYTPSRTSSAGSVATQSDLRPVLKHTGTSESVPKHKPQAHVSFLNPNRMATVHMHPLLSCTRLHSAPLSYDVTYPPSSHTILDRYTLTAVPAHTLAQPATEPPTMNKLVFRCEKLPWSVLVHPSQRRTEDSPSKRTRPRFYIDSRFEKDDCGRGTPITNVDVLHSLYEMLSMRVTKEEWEQLGHGSRNQRKVKRAYEKRCERMGGGWDAGVRRIDFLEGKTSLVGIEMVMNKRSSKDSDSSDASGVGKLFFAKPKYKSSSHE